MITLLLVFFSEEMGNNAWHSDIYAPRQKKSVFFLFDCMCEKMRKKVAQCIWSFSFIALFRSKSWIRGSGWASLLRFFFLQLCFAFLLSTHFRWIWCAAPFISPVVVVENLGEGPVTVQIMQFQMKPEVKIETVDATTFLSIGVFLSKKICFLCTQVYWWFFRCCFHRQKNPAIIVTLFQCFFFFLFIQEKKTYFQLISLFIAATHNQFDGVE